MRYVLTRQRALRPWWILDSLGTSSYKLYACALYSHVQVSTGILVPIIITIVVIIKRLTLL